MTQIITYAHSLLIYKKQILGEDDCRRSREEGGNVFIFKNYLDGRGLKFTGDTNGRTNTTPSSITTSVSSTSLGKFNGCWLTVQVPVDVDYTAPQDGWWKIRYNMTGTGTSNDVTTWKVALIGNPVHLVYP